jgi:3-oxoacyl-[acyl-carrier protein] reductase
MESSSRLDGRVAVVTGASRGIGLAVAELLAAHGASVVVSSRADAAALEGIASKLPPVSGTAHMAASMDVADSAQVAGLYRQIFARYKRLDILVNNAGILGDGLIGMIPDSVIEQTLATNVKGSIYNLQAAARLMQRNQSGAIVNMSSIMGTRGNAGQIVYGASKAALIGLTLSAAKELAPRNIRVNAVAPGFIETPMTTGLDDKIQAQRTAAIGMGRAGTPRDVANAVLYLVSDLSSYVTGQVLGVDGGMIQ